MKYHIAQYFFSSTYVSFICYIQMQVIGVCEIAKFSKQSRIFGQKERIEMKCQVKLLKRE